jgi:tetratricopeptide (TPR) repeat protein
MSQANSDEVVKPTAEDTADEVRLSDDPDIAAFQRRVRDPELRAADNAMMAAAGALAGLMGEPEELRKKNAIKYYEVAVSHDPGLSHAWRQLGGLYGKEGRYEASKHAFEKALATASDAGEEGVALWGLGLAAADRKESAIAEEHFSRAASRLEGVDDEKETLVSCVKNVASLKYHRRAADAEQAIKDARALAKSHGFPEHELDCVHWLIGIARSASRTSDLEGLLPAALELEERLNRKGDQVRSHRMLSGLAQMRGDRSSARRHAERTCSLAHEVGDDENGAIAHYELGKMARDENDAEAAYTHLKQSLDLAQSHGNQRFLVEVLNQLGDLEYRCDKFDNARRFLERALSLAGEAGDSSGQAAALYVLGSVAEDLGDHDEKMRSWRAALERASAAGDAKMVENISALLRDG